MSLEEMVGRQLVFGVGGPDVTDADLRLFEETRAGGLILYRRNFEGPERLAAMLTQLERALGRRLLVTTDHEGGRIIMLGAGVTIFPDNLAVGTAGEVAFAKRQGLIEGRELRRLGVDVSFGPVLDVLTERYSPNIGIRSYGKDPELVGRFGAARIEGLQASGVSACAKHFPGKGHAPVDAHLGLPVIDSDWGDMHAVHLVPFMAAMEAGVDCLMTSHPLYPNLDPEPRTPATFSRLIVDDYLRGQVGYRGVVASDDLEMGAITDLCPIGDATVRAAAAGHALEGVEQRSVRRVQVGVVQEQDAGVGGGGPGEHLADLGLRGVDADHVHLGGDAVGRHRLREESRLVQHGRLDGDAVGEGGQAREHRDDVSIQAPAEARRWRRHDGGGARGDGLGEGLAIRRRARRPAIEAARAPGRERVEARDAPLE